MQDGQVILKFHVKCTNTMLDNPDPR
jgi:hypothetical protein